MSDPHATQHLALELCVPATHPALPGHFPGAPVVPGVLLIDLLLDAAERALGRALEPHALAHVKFLAPLLPAQVARADASLEGTRLRFRVEHAGQPLASGLMELA
jgi:3-hydroxyacyl-[acyl-carrier-protein] dehydratase